MYIAKDYVGLWGSGTTDDLNDLNSEREQYAFDVEMKPVMFDSTVNAPNMREYLDRKVIVRKDIGRPLAVVSNAYRPVLHTTIVDTLDEEFKREHLAFSRRIRVLGYGAKMALTYRFPEHKVQIREGDEVCMTLDVLNSFNTQTSVFMDLGGFRWKCSNGMRVGLTIALLKAIHKGEMHAKVETMGSNLADATNKFKEQGALWRAYANTPLTLDDFDSLIQALEDRKIALPRKRALNMIRSRFASSESASIWGMYNAITHVASYRVRGFQTSNALLNFANRATGIAYGGV